MRFHPRHYVLIALILGVFLYNLYRRTHKPAPAPIAATPVVHTAPRADTPAWAAFDHAAALRDAPDNQLQPALQALQRQLAATPPDPGASDIKGCLTWLQFYRQSTLHPSRDPAWHDRSVHHLTGCTTFHLDTSS